MAGAVPDRLAELPFVPHAEPNRQLESRTRRTNGRGGHAVRVGAVATGAVATGPNP